MRRGRRPRWLNGRYYVGIQTEQVGRVVLVLHLHEAVVVFPVIDVDHLFGLVADLIRIPANSERFVSFPFLAAVSNGRI